MTFVTGGLAAAGVLAMAIPIIIFLLWRQRRTPIAWAAMRFLAEAYRKHRRRLQVEQLLLLAVRCLVLALLGLALARPLLEGTSLLDGGGARIVYLVVDDGLASDLRSPDGGAALAAHVATAKEIIGALAPADRVGLISAARPARTVLSPPSTDHDAVIDLLESMEARATPTDLPAAIDRLRSVLDDLDEEHEQVFAYLLSDFRAGSAALDEALPASRSGAAEADDGRVRLIAAPPATAPIGNIQITAVEPARSLILAGANDGSRQVTVRLARQGGDLDRDVTSVRLVGENVTYVEPEIVGWAPGQTEARAEFFLDFSASGERDAGVSAVIDDDPLDADNRRHVVLALRKEIRVNLLDRRSFGAEPELDQMSASQWIRRALAPDDAGAIDVIMVEPAALAVPDLRTADVTVVPRPDLLTEPGWTLLRGFVDRGGVLIVTPPQERRVHRWTDDFERHLGLGWSIAREVAEHPEGLVLADEQPRSTLLRMIASDLEDLTRPIVTRRTLPVDPPQTNGRPILMMANGQPFMVVGSPQPAAAPDPAPDPAPGETPGETTGDGARPTGLVAYLVVAPQLEWTNLPAKPLMVPLFQETLRQGLSLVRSTGAAEIGTRPALLVGPAASAVVAPDGASIALDRGQRPERGLDQPGLYRVVDQAAQEIGTIAVNVDPGAGRSEPQPASAVMSWLQASGPWTAFDPDDVAADLRRRDSGSPLAGLLLALVLVLILVEVVLARWFSHAERIGKGGATIGLQPTMSGAGGGAAATLRRGGGGG